jgi:hypothetical protein
MKPLGEMPKGAMAAREARRIIAMMRLRRPSLRQATLGAGRFTP